MKEKKISVSETSVFRNFWACTFGFLGFLKNTFLYICIMDMEWINADKQVQILQND